MARFVDLDDEEEPEQNLDNGAVKVEQGRTPARACALRIGAPTANQGLFSAALNCYPIALSLIRNLDLVSLENLSRSCRLFRAILLPCRSHLISNTLRCHVEQQQQVFPNQSGPARFNSGQRSPTCARDMVGECRRCGITVCRNCTVKVPHARLVKNRHRRLCRTCMRAPLDLLTTRIHVRDHDDTLGPAEHNDHQDENKKFARSPCTCEDNVWICVPCGYNNTINDTTYARGWAWRTRYSVCGGFGAGLGEGNEGVECGRTNDTVCLAGRQVEHEIECDAVTAAMLEKEDSRTGSPAAQPWSGSSYTTHEMVGIGGRVKRKLRKVVAVGAIVKEYEDERASGKFLWREQEGSNRSWCSWCARVIPSKKDLAPTALVDQLVLLTTQDMLEGEGKSDVSSRHPTARA